MKVQRNISSAFIFISAFIAVAYSAAYFSEDELMDQIHEDLKLFNRMQAREQGMAMSASLLPYSSPPFNPFLPGRSNTRKVSQQRTISIGSTFVSPRKAWLQEKTLQQLFSRLLADPIKDARAMKYWHASKLHKKVKMETTVEGRIQDYIKTLNKTEMKEKAQELIDKLFTCSINKLPDLIESLKGTLDFGKPISRLLDGYKTLTDKSSSGGLYFFKKFISLVSYVLNPDDLVAEEQVFDKELFKELRRLFKDGFESFAEIPKQRGNEIFRNLLNIASGFMSSENLTTEGRARFNKSINFFVEKYFFKQIDGMDKSKEDKIAMKKALRSAVNTVIAAIFKMWNGESPNPDNRTSLLRSIITVLVSLNHGSIDTPLLHYIDKFLARNPTNEELSTKSQCLLLVFLRKSLEYVLYILEREQCKAKETGAVECAVDLMIGGYRMFLEYIPTRVSNVEGCEDFAAIGYKGVAQDATLCPE